MTAELDRRDEQSPLLTPERKAELQSAAAELRKRIPELDVQITGFDTRTGNPRRVRLSGAPPRSEASLDHALAILQLIAPALGFAPGQPVEFAAQGGVAKSSTGAAAVNLRQQYKGIPIFGADVIVRFASNGSVTEVGGTTVTVTSDLPVVPDVPPVAAAAQVVDHLLRSEPRESAKTDQFGQALSDISVAVTDFSPRVLAMFTSLPARPTVFEAGPFDELKASLVWCPLGAHTILGWEVSLRLSGGGREFHCVVDATTASIIFAKLRPLRQQRTR